jgi:hypothetical protein
LARVLPVVDAPASLFGLGVHRFDNVGRLERAFASRALEAAGAPRAPGKPTA